MIKAFYLFSPLVFSSLLFSIIRPSKWISPFLCIMAFSCFLGVLGTANSGSIQELVEFNALGIKVVKILAFIFLGVCLLNWNNKNQLVTPIISLLFICVIFLLGAKTFPVYLISSLLVNISLTIFCLTSTSSRFKENSYRFVFLNFVFVFLNLILMGLLVNATGGLSLSPSNIESEPFFFCYVLTFILISLIYIGAAPFLGWKISFFSFNKLSDKIVVTLILHLVYGFFYISFAKRYIDLLSPQFYLVIEVILNCFGIIGLGIFIFNACLGQDHKKFVSLSLLAVGVFLFCLPQFKFSTSSVVNIFNLLYVSFLCHSGLCLVIESLSPMQESKKLGLIGAYYHDHLRGILIIIFTLGLCCFPFTLGYESLLSLLSDKGSYSNNAFLSMVIMYLGLSFIVFFRIGSAIFSPEIIKKNFQVESLGFNDKIILLVLIVIIFLGEYNPIFKLNKLIE